MFEKLVSLLPYNPGLAGQLAFYSQRMREEASIRRIGTVFIVLAFMVQFFAVLSPPQSTSASPGNDLVNGGIRSADEAARICRQNVRNFGDIMNTFGITCNDVAAAGTVSLRSTEQNNKLFSMGHIPYGQTNPQSGKATGEVPVNINNGPTIYARHLSSWDTGPYSTYKALKLKSTVTGKTYFILYDCGNLVSIGVPNPVNLCKFDPRLPANDPKCFKPCKYDKDLPADSKRCFEACPIPGKKDLPKDSPKCTEPCPYDKKLPAKSPKCFEPCPYNEDLPKRSPDCYQPCRYNPSLPAGDPKCKPCDRGDAAACVIVSKSAINVTSGGGDANNTTANPGDVITYTLYAQNNAKKTIKGFVFQENLSDVLDYADIVTLNGGTLNADKVVVWSGVDIPAGKKVTKQITVKVKDPIPQTPAAPGDPGHFDLIMTNVYGNSVNIKLPGTPEKTIEEITAGTTLPNTGPGTNLAIAASLVIIAGYFYGRARLLSTESKLALQDAATA